MKTKKSKDIPEDEWGNAPPIDKWFEEAVKARAQIKREQIRLPSRLPPKVEITNTVGTSIDFNSCRPANNDHQEHFSLAKGLLINDIGVQDGCICIALLGGELNVDFVDKTLEIEPHSNGKIIDYHTPVPQKLTEVFIYKPTADSGITSCIFVIQGENQTFEYLLTPRIDSVSFSFHLEFNHA